MSNQFLKLRRSSVPGKIPTTSSLEFGEIALNTYDGLAFIKKSGSNGEEVVPIGVTSGSFTGSLFGTASWAIEALTSSYSLNINGETYYVAVYTGNNSLGTGSLYDSASFTAVGTITPSDAANPERFFVDAGNTNSYNLISGHGEIDNYLQLNVQNFSYGATASSDIVATANDGTQNDNYIDMGINNSGYNVQDGIGGPNDAYLYSTGNDLLIGNVSDGKKIIIFNGSGGALANARIIVFDQGTVGINANTANNANPEALLVEPLPGSTNDFNNLIVGRAEVQENYVQLNIQNLGSGSIASADIVATNDIGTETDYYIDMGINSSNYATPNLVGGPNDAYLYSTGEHLHIGNASVGQPIMFFAGGLDADVNQKLYLDPNNRHMMTGSLEVSGSVTATEGFTGSLYGTASWAENTITASFITASSVYGPFGSNSVESASFAITASYATYVSGTVANAVSAAYADTASWSINAFTASFVTASDVYGPFGSNSILSASYAVSSSNSVSASYSFSSSYALSSSFSDQSLSSSFATNAATASSADDFVVRGSLTGSDALFTGTITAQRLNVQYITASTEFITGSTKFGTQITDTHQFTGSVSISGSLSVNGTLNATSSFAVNALTASFVTASNVYGPFGSNSIVSSSYALTASFALNAGVSDPFPYTGSAIISGSLKITGSFSTDRDISVNSITLGRGAGNIASNVALGSGSLASNTYGTNNVAVGNNSLYSNTGGNCNVAIGSNSLRNNIAGSYNMAIGFGALKSNNNGSSNVAVGYRALYNNTTGAGNMAIGRQVLYYNTSGRRNVGIGSYALCNNSIGGCNMAIGEQALLRNTSGSANVAIGYSALAYNTSGQRNIAIGINSGLKITSGNCNVFIGGYTGSDAVATQNRNIFISDGSNGPASLRLFITGSNGLATFYGTGGVSASAFTGSLLGTSSWAQNAVTASYVTASNVFGPFGSNSVISSSYALTASFALNAGGAAASPTNQIATGSVTASVNIGTSSFQLTSASVQLLSVSSSGLITGQRMFLSASQNTISGSTLTVYGSGSAQPVFTVQGSQGELFSVTDSLSGSLFSVNDISGLPIVEVFSDNRTLIGSYQAPALITTVRTTSTIGNNVIYQNLPTASYDGAFFDYTLRSGSNARAGQITAMWSGSSVNFTETTTTDFGDTSGVRFGVIITGSNMALTGSFPSASWTMKTIVRSI